MKFSYAVKRNLAQGNHRRSPEGNMKNVSPDGKDLPGLYTKRSML